MRWEVRDLIVRYSLLVAFALLIPFYQFVLVPLTLYPTTFLLSLFYEVNLSGNSILINGSYIEIISACAGISATFLLLILNLSTPLIKWPKRLHLFFYTFALFLIFNWIRVFFLAYLFLKEYVMFVQIHFFLWYAVSTVIVAAIWIIAVRAFKIKYSPILSDILYLRSKTKK